MANGKKEMDIKVLEEIKRAKTIHRGSLIRSLQKEEPRERRYPIVIRALEKAGYIRTEPNKGLMLTKKGLESLD